MTEDELVGWHHRHGGHEFEQTLEDGEGEGSPVCCTPWAVAHQASLSSTNFQSLLKLVFIKGVMPSNHLILCHPLYLMPSIFASIRVSSNESALHIRCSKHWSFSFSVTLSNEYLGLISYSMDWLDLLAVQGTLKSLLQHTIQKHQFFYTQLSLWSNSHIHTSLLEKPWTFVGNVSAF